MVARIAQRCGAMEVVIDYCRKVAPWRQPRIGRGSDRLAGNKVPTRLKGVIDLVIFRGLKYQEAADTLRIPLGSVKSRMNAAVVRLSRTFMVPARVD